MSESDRLTGGVPRKRAWYENIKVGTKGGAFFLFFDPAPLTKVWLVIGAFVLAGLAVIVPLAVIFGRSGSLVTAVRVDGIRTHLENLQAVAAANGGERHLREERGTAR